MSESIVPNRIREHTLRALFPIAAGWAFLLLLSGYLDRLHARNPFPEGAGWHNLVEALVNQYTVTAVVIVLAVWLVVRRWDFLRLPPGLPLHRIVIRLLVHGAIEFVAVMVLAVAVFYAFHDPSKDPQGQFHIWVWLGGFICALGLTPVTALLTVWWSLRDNSKGIA